MSENSKQIIDLVAKAKCPSNNKVVADSYYAAAADVIWNTHLQCATSNDRSTSPTKELFNELSEYYKDDLPLIFNRMVDACGDPLRQKFLITLGMEYSQHASDIKSFATNPFMGRGIWRQPPVDSRPGTPTIPTLSS